MDRNEITKELFRLRDEKYAEMQRKIILGLPPEYFIGVRTPALRAFAKELYKNGDTSEFLGELPHQYFDEYQLHAFITALIPDFESCIEATEIFLPFIDNWATCDQFSPKVFKKNKEKLLPYIRKWISSEHTYTIRFAIGMLMQHFLNESFSPEYPEMAASVPTDEYYVKMEIAWYFATALAKQYDAVIPYIENKRLDDWTHNKTIQKSIESYRITPEQKAYLRSLKKTKN